MTIAQRLRTVLVLTKLNTKRFFRDRVAQFFGIMFPLIFLVVFGSIGGNNANVSFKVALLNQSHSQFANNFAGQIKSGKVFKVDAKANSLAAAKDKLGRGQIDGIIVLPAGFGDQKPGQAYPSGNAELLFSQSSSGTGQTLTSVLQGTFKGLNAKYAPSAPPFSVEGKQLNQKRLSSFDYTFAGLLGFSIIGLGVFGPMNVFPELKKQGILRRLHTTPLKVWQYFMATMFSQALTGLISIAIQFAIAIKFFHLHVVGNYFEIALFIVLSIFMILGIGLSIGGWAKNERQAAPIGNVIVFPMLFLSGTFFPRFAMPELLQKISAFLPLTPVIDGLRLLTTEGKHLVDIGPQLGLMLLWFVIIYAIAFRLFKWE